MSYANDAECPACKDTVLASDRLVAMNESWHRWCFRCSRCKTTLTLGRQNEHKGMLFCNKCYKEGFGTEGFGRGGIGRGVYSKAAEAPATGEAAAPAAAVPEGPVDATARRSSKAGSKGSRHKSSSSGSRKRRSSSSKSPGRRRRSSSGSGSGGKQAAQAMLAKSTFVGPDVSATDFTDNLSSDEEDVPELRKDSDAKRGSATFKAPIGAPPAAKEAPAVDEVVPSGAMSFVDYTAEHSSDEEEPLPAD